MSTRLAAAIAELADALQEEVRAELRDAAGAPDHLLSVAEAAKRIGLGRTALYGALGSGRIRSVVVGRRRLVPSSAIAELAQSPPGPGK